SLAVQTTRSLTSAEDFCDRIAGRARHSQERGPMAFHEVRLPARLAFGSTGGVERRTEITTLASGFERRSTPWAQGRRRYLIGAGLRSLDDMAELTAFFEARRGRLHGFRFRDFADCKS